MKEFMSFALRSMERFWWNGEERLGRVEYLIGKAGALALVTPVAFAVMVLPLPTGVRLGVLIPVVLVYALRDVINTVYRLHDAGRCGWWWWLPWIVGGLGVWLAWPLGWVVCMGVVGVVSLAWQWFLFAPAEARANRYGAPVRDYDMPRWVLVLVAMALSGTPLQMRFDDREPEVRTPPALAEAKVGAKVQVSVLAGQWTTAWGGREARLALLVAPERSEEGAAAYVQGPWDGREMITHHAWGWQVTLTPEGAAGEMVLRVEPPRGWRTRAACATRVVVPEMAAEGDLFEEMGTLLFCEQFTWKPEAVPPERVW